MDGWRVVGSRYSGGVEGSSPMVPCAPVLGELPMCLSPHLETYQPHVATRLPPGPSAAPTGDQ